MAQTWPLYGPNNLSFNCIHLFGLLDSSVKIEPHPASRSEDIVEIGKTWALYGQNMALIWSQY